MSDCEFCDVELNAMPFICPKCGKHFCKKHKMPKDHDCEKIDSAQMVDPQILNHEKKEEENSKYIQEEVAVIKRRIKKKSFLQELLSLLWRYNLLVLIVLLVFTSFYIQASGTYDLVSSSKKVWDDMSIVIGFFENESIAPIINNITELEKVPIVAQTVDKTLISRINEEPRRYLDSKVNVEGKVIYDFYKVGPREFEYKIVDEKGNSIYFTLVQAMGFNKYYNYKVVGVVTEYGDILYIDSSNVERII